MAKYILLLLTRQSLQAIRICLQPPSERIRMQILEIGETTQLEPVLLSFNCRTQRFWTLSLASARESKRGKCPPKEILQPPHLLSSPKLNKLNRDRLFGTL